MPDVVRALRRVAPRVTGQLVDALLDPAADPVVRRRVPRVLKACPTVRAALGLQLALDDPAFDVRAAAAAALAAIHERSAVVRVTREEVLTRVRRELDSGETVERQIPQIYALLSLVLERGPLQIAWAAMKGDDRSLRGTALEYLANVLPEDVFKRLRSCFGAGTWTAARSRDRSRSWPTSCATRRSACTSSTRPGARPARPARPADGTLRLAGEPGRPPRRLVAGDSMRLVHDLGRDAVYALRPCAGSPPSRRRASASWPSRSAARPRCSAWWTPRCCASFRIGIRARSCPSATRPTALTRRACRSPDRGVRASRAHPDRPRGVLPEHRDLARHAHGRAGAGGGQGGLRERRALPCSRSRARPRPDLRRRRAGRRRARGGDLHRLWQRRFAGSAAALGAPLEIDGSRAIVVGVMPPSFAFPDRSVELWLPLTTNRSFRNDAEGQALYWWIAVGGSLRQPPPKPISTDPRERPRPRASASACVGSMPLSAASPLTRYPRPRLSASSDRILEPGATAARPARRQARARRTR